MALNRKEQVLSKLYSLAEKTLTKANVQFALDNWLNPEFPPKLERKVRLWFRDKSALADAALQVAYAEVDEQSAKWLTDPCIEAQKALVILNDEDDLALMVKRCKDYTTISIRLWRYLSECELSKTLVNTLLDREDVANVFLKAYGSKTPSTSRRSKRSQLQGDPVGRRGNTGSARRVVKPVKEQTPRKTVNKGRTNSISSRGTGEKPVNTKRVRTASRAVRRPNP